MQQLEKLPWEEQQEVFAYLTTKVADGNGATSKPWLGKKLSFEEACNVVFRENRELLNLLAK